jgi:O-acetyl-ADP-ribose deacetylase (regulator of RNase III)
MRYQEIKGDLIELAKAGSFDVIAHGCNCHSTMGAGLAPQMAKAFGCDKFEMERLGSTISKLGNIDYQHFVISKWSLEDFKNDLIKPELTVVNAYTQYNYGRNHEDGVLRPIDYEALTLCLRKMNMEFQGKHIGLPMIGAGLAGGDWDHIKYLIQKELRDCQVTVVIYEKPSSNKLSLDEIMRDAFKQNKLIDEKTSNDSEN